MAATGWTIGRRGFIAAAAAVAVPALGSGSRMRTGPTGVRLTRPMDHVPIAQALHAGFPGVEYMPDGSLHLVWRLGGSHLERDGRIQRAISWDCGETYGETVTLRVGPVDYRDPSISYVDGAAHMTWFPASATAPAQGAYTMREWGETVRIDTLPYAAITAPIVQLPDGRLGAAFYGRKADEPRDTAWMGWYDGSWTTNRILNGIGIGRDYNEPWIVVDGEMIHFFARWGGWSGIGVRSSPDSGQTWLPERQILTNATGRPTAIATSSGVLIMVYREIPSLAARLAYSLDHGQTWLDGGRVLDAPGPGTPGMTYLGMVYAAMTEICTGDVYLVVAMEQPDGSSRLFHSILAVEQAA